MAHITQLVALGIVLALTTAGAWVMNMFFGWVGVLLLGGFMVPMLLFVRYMNQRNSGGGSSRSTQGRTSKGARKK